MKEVKQLAYGETGAKDFIDGTESLLVDNGKHAFNAGQRKVNAKTSEKAEDVAEEGSNSDEDDDDGN